MLPLIATVVPLGIAAAMHPTLVALQLLLVSQPHSWPRARALAIGATAPLVAVGALAYLGFAQLPSPQPGVVDIVGVGLRSVIGLAFLAASVWLLWAHPGLQRRSANFVTEKVTSGSPRDFLILGLVLNGKSLTTFALLLPALHDISAVSDPEAVKMVALVVLFGLASSPAWGPIALSRALGSRGAARLARMSSWVIDHDLRILGVMALLIGLYLTGSAAALVAVLS